MKNAIFVIKPYKWNGIWVFDDERVGLDKEPFVAGTDTMIETAVQLKGIPNSDGGFLMVFSAGPFPDADFEVEWVREEIEGNVYRGRFEVNGEVQEMEGWLCPALNLYYPEAPKKLYVQVREAKEAPTAMSTNLEIFTIGHSTHPLGTFVWLLRKHGIDALVDIPILCAEALYWQCHRRLVSDYLRANGIGVQHIFPSGELRPHELTAGAKVLDGAVTYPGQPTLFDVVGSRADETVPFADSEELVRNSGRPSAALIVDGTEHRLADEESLAAMLQVCERIGSPADSVLDHPAISGRYLFPQPRYIDDPFIVEVAGAELACYRRFIDPDNFTVVHFHGNGEAVADYIPDMAVLFADLGLNSLFVEYREYGGSTGLAKLVAMLGDGEAALEAANLPPDRVIAFGRSLGSLYAIELVHRQPAVAGLILESGIADPSERFLRYADLTTAGVAESDVVAEVERHFSHEKKLSQYKNPLLILHTENDGLIDVNHAERNYQWAGSTRKRLVRFPFGNHNTIFGSNMREYLAAIGAFAGSIKN